MKYNLSKRNYLVMAISFVVIVIGCVLMVGSESGTTEYNPDIFSVRRIVIAPIVCMVGFVGMIVGILLKGGSRGDKA